MVEIDDPRVGVLAMKIEGEFKRSDTYSIIREKFNYREGLIAESDLSFLFKRWAKFILNAEEAKNESI